MKKRYIALLVALGFLLVWLGSMGVAGVLTALYADEFTDFEAMDLQWLSGESYERRVLQRFLRGMHPICETGRAMESRKRSCNLVQSRQCR